MDYDRVMQALRKADASGDTEAARRLAQIAKQMQESGTLRIEVTTGPEQPSEMPTMTGLDEYGVDSVEQTQLPTLPSASYNPILRGMIYDPIAALREMGGAESRANVAEEERKYQEWRKEQGDEGFEWGRLAGGVIVPLPGAAMLKGGGAMAKAIKTAAFGAGAATLQPTFKNNEDLASYLSQKVVQGGQGAAFGGLMSLAGSGIGGITDFITEVTKPLTEKGRTQLIKDYLDKLVDPADRVRVINALENAQEIVPGSRPTAAQALADVPQGANLAAAQRMQEGVNPAPFRTREAEQVAAQRAQLDPFSQQAQQQALEARRAAITDPMRTQALEEANRLGPTIQAAEQRAAQLEQEAIAAANAAPIQQKATTIADFAKQQQELSAAGNAASAKQAQAAMFRTQVDQLRSTGQYFLSPSRIIGSIDNVMASPGKGANDILVRSLAKTRQQIAEKTRNGVIDAEDLYQIRKNINENIRSVVADPASANKQVLAGVEKDIKRLIDKEINKAGPSGMWDRYLKSYQKYSRLANQVQIGNYLKGKLGEAYVTDIPNAGAFYTAVNDAAKTIQRAGVGGPRYDDLSKVMSAKQLKSIYAVRDDLQRIAKGKAAMRPSQAAGGDITSTPEFPQLLNQNIAIVNAIIKAVKKDAVGGMNEKLQQMFLDPKQLASFISMVPKDKADDLVAFIWGRAAPETRAAMRRALAVSGAVELANRPDM